jgi:riboflavin synthase
LRSLYEIEQVVVKIDVEEVRQGLAVNALSVVREHAKNDLVNLNNSMVKIAGNGVRRTESAFSLRESQ